MIYPFRDLDTGEPVEVSMSMADAPSIGDVIDHEGRRLVRLPSRPEAIVRGFEPFSTPQMPRWDAAAKRHDARGRPLFATRKERDEYCAKTQDRARMAYHAEE